MEDWSTSYFLPLLSPLFLLFSDRFLPVRPLFCVCFVLLWPSVFARLLCIISVLASVFLFVVFGPVFSVYYLCLLYVRSSLFFLGFFRSFVLSAFAFYFPSSFPCCVLCVSFPCCVLFVDFLFFSFSPFVLLFSRFALCPLVFLLFVPSSSFPLM
ncbi:hypothetical protein NC653_039686 [Populus alba x Populus x berolinensis]|uniref:Uncharacterized protein n=1 Tax=Populus alba x Populus x berolinensis TaxID=444605 RepID=A0AAD6PQW6_9ROSI|nr:hypothetical protein NC653_039686 [Populus alba x Populus x berolinensis]